MIKRKLARIFYKRNKGATKTSINPKVMEVHGLEMTYDKKNKVLKGLNFDIHKNEFTVILGSSGCGKTTMMNAIGGMLKPTEGEILWNNKNIVKMKDKDITSYRRDSIGFVFQQYNLIQDLTARENIQVATSLVKNAMSADEALKYVDLLEKADEYPGKLSGGEQQRICIARAIAKRSSVLLCDEPTGALDTENAMRVIRILMKLAKEDGVAVVMITHNTLLSSIADHLIMMSNGEIIDDFYQTYPMSVNHLKLR